MFIMEERRRNVGTLNQCSTRNVGYLMVVEKEEEEEKVMLQIIGNVAANERKTENYKNCCCK